MIVHFHSKPNETGRIIPGSLVEEGTFVVKGRSILAKVSVYGWEKFADFGFGVKSFKGELALISPVTGRVSEVMVDNDGCYNDDCCDDDDWIITEDDSWLEQGQPLLRIEPMDYAVEESITEIKFKDSIPRLVTQVFIQPGDILNGRDFNIGEVTYFTEKMFSVLESEGENIAEMTYFSSSFREKRKLGLYEKVVEVCIKPGQMISPGDVIAKVALEKLDK